MALTWQPSGRHASNDAGVDDDVDDDNGGSAGVPMVAGDCDLSGGCEGVHCVAEATGISMVHSW